MSKTDRRIRTIKTKLTENEYQKLLQLQKDTGLSRMELIRQAIFKTNTLVPIKAQDILKELDCIGTEMGRIGNNINQFAKHAHIQTRQGLIISDTLDNFNDKLEKYISLQIQMEKIIRQLLRLLKNK